MITLHRLGHRSEPLHLNPDLITTVEAHPDTVVTLATGFLEGSNVDLAQQFTNMIMAERGFQANSRVITTSDEILQDLVNIKH